MNGKADGPAEGSSPRATSRPGSLFVEFLGQERELAVGKSLSFGRDAELVVDDANPYLHRVLGIFVSVDSIWVLQNVGRHIPMTIRDRFGRSRIEVVPGDQVPMVIEEFVVSFSAGPARYELQGALSSAPPIGLHSVGPSDTLEYGAVRLNVEQRMMVSALAEPLLRNDPSWPADMPSNREVAARLGWTVTKFNRKLDYLCSRLAGQGVSGLQGGAGIHATGRRQRLVEHLVERRLVTLDDLEDEGRLDR